MVRGSPQTKHSQIGFPDAHPTGAFGQSRHGNCGHKFLTQYENQRKVSVRSTRNFLLRIVSDACKLTEENSDSICNTERTNCFDFGNLLIFEKTLKPYISVYFFNSGVGGADGSTNQSPSLAVRDVCSAQGISDEDTRAAVTKVWPQRGAVRRLCVAGGTDCCLASIVWNVFSSIWSTLTGRDRAKIFRDPRFSGYHSPTLSIGSHF